VRGGGGEKRNTGADGRVRVDLFLATFDCFFFFFSGSEFSLLSLRVDFEPRTRRGGGATRRVSGTATATDASKRFMVRKVISHIMVKSIKTASWRPRRVARPPNQPASAPGE
jgi:hypothetical protein